jgi:hypothetical protein
MGMTQCMMLEKWNVLAALYQLSYFARVVTIEIQYGIKEKAVL